MNRKVLLQLTLPLVGLSVLFWLLAFAPGEKHHRPTLLEMSVILRDGDGAVSTMRKGMEQAANFAPYSYPAVKDYYLDYRLTELPEQAAIKTGTPQMTSAEDTGSAFIGFYPSDDPVIAFSGFVEHGEYSKFMIRQII